MANQIQTRMEAARPNGLQNRRRRIAGTARHGGQAELRRIAGAPVPCG